MERSSPSSKRDETIQKRFALYTFPDAIVIEPNLTWYPDTQFSIKTLFSVLPNSVEENYKNLLPPQLIISRRQDITKPMTLRQTAIESERYPTQNYSNGSTNLNKSVMYFDALLGLVEINGHQFLVVCTQSLPVAEFPSDYPNCLLPDQYSGLHSSRPDGLWKLRRDSIVNMMQRVQLIPFELTTELWHVDEKHPKWEGVQSILTPSVCKIRRNMEIFLSKHHYYSYDINITKSLQNQYLNNGYRPAGFPAQSQYYPMFTEWLLGRDTNPANLDTVNKMTYIKSFMDVSESRFVWNTGISGAFEEFNIDKHWLVPVVQGHCGWTTITMQMDLKPLIEGDLSKDLPDKKHQLDIYLIGRREWIRSGTRYHCRGINKDGHVSNFVETEMIIHLGYADPSFPGVIPQGVHRLPPSQRQVLVEQFGRAYSNDSHELGFGWSSFLQIRGSVPLYWEQSMFGRGTNPAQPPPVLSIFRNPNPLSNVKSDKYTEQLNTQAYQTHFRSLRREYGDVWCFNLLSGTRGNESDLTMAWRQIDKDWKSERLGGHGSGGYAKDLRVNKHNIAAIEFPKIIEIDFHKNQKQYGFLGSLNYNFLSCGMLDALTSTANFQERPFSFVNSLHQLQRGIIRTNCLDCLDRTNAFQYWFGWMFLRSYLKERGFGMFICEDVEMVNAELRAPDSGSNIEYLATSLARSKMRNAEWKRYSGAFRMRGRGALDNEEPMERLIHFRSHKSYANLNANNIESDDVNLFQYITSLMWGEHGDRISQIYTGTGSVITPLMVSGKVSMNQKMNHLTRSVNRFYQNLVEDNNRNEVILALANDWRNHSSIMADGDNISESSITRTIANDKSVDSAMSSVNNVSKATSNKRSSPANVLFNKSDFEENSNPNLELDDLLKDLEA